MLVCALCAMEVIAGALLDWFGGEVGEWEYRPGAARSRMVKCRK